MVLLTPVSTDLRISIAFIFIAKPTATEVISNEKIVFNLTTVTKRSSKATPKITMIRGIIIYI